MKSILLLTLIALISCLSGGWEKRSLAENNLYIDRSFKEAYKAYANDANVDADDFIPLTVYSQIVAGTNFKVCFIDRKSEIPSVQEVMVHVPLPTNGRNGLVFKIILKMERHSREIHNLNDESFALAGNHLTKELERTDEKFVKINNLYRAESMENIFYIVNAQTEKGEHQYVFTEDKKTGELDYINKIR